ncbi:hypothetical protein BG004_005665 [Podila humilis]|nr:hypothetical protein BG004_005665 [Podila humilis]
MEPWSSEELRTCRANITGFSVVPLEIMTDFYSKIGGVPTYVLETPRQAFTAYPYDVAFIKTLACTHLEEALDKVKDSVALMQ